MPELPEVEYGRKLCEVVAVGRTIVRARCRHDELVYQGTTAAAVARALKGRAVAAARRHGKYLWWELDARPWPVFHFGMTGAFRALGELPLQLASGPKIHDEAGTRDEPWPPRFTKFEVELDDGRKLAMTCARRIGRIRLRTDPAHEPPISRLGFDPLVDMPRLEGFETALRRRKGVIKSVMLDQRFAAGVGNWIADEVLYQARIDPRRTVDTLSRDEVAALRTKLRHVVRKAVEVDANKDRFPRTWLFHKRWGKVEGQRMGRDPIVFVEIGGRTTAWVPARQR